jgi:hypothetical protein
MNTDTYAMNNAFAGWGTCDGRMRLMRRGAVEISAGVWGCPKNQGQGEQIRAGLAFDLQALTGCCPNAIKQNYSCSIALQEKPDLGSSPL